MFKGKNFGSEILDTCTKLTTENRSKENALAGKIEKGPKIKFGKIEKGPKIKSTTFSSLANLSKTLTTFNPKRDDDGHKKRHQS